MHTTTKSRDTGLKLLHTVYFQWLKLIRGKVVWRRYLSRKAEVEEGVEACVRDSADNDCRPPLWR